MLKGGQVERPRSNVEREEKEKVTRVAAERYGAQRNKTSNVERRTEQKSKVKSRKERKKEKEGNVEQRTLNNERWTEAAAARILSCGIY